MSYLKKTVFTFLAILSSYFIIEFFSLLVIAFIYNAFISPADYFDRLTGFGWHQSIDQKCDPKFDAFESDKNRPEAERLAYKISKLSFLNTLGPHPYLGYTMWAANQPDCDARIKKFGNNENLTGPDFPIEKEKEFYTILLTGGSVASILGNINDGKTFYLESFLNHHYISPNGKKIKVLSAAIGDFRFPQNLISFLLYNHLADAVIDLSGFNESNNFIDMNAKLERPSPSYWGIFDLEIENEIFQKKKDIYAISANGRLNRFCSSSYICMTILFSLVQNKVNTLKQYKDQHVPRYIPHQSYFYFDSNLPNEKKLQLKNEKLKNYYRIWNSICTVQKFKCSFFLQPIPQIAKVLSAEEQMVVPNDPHRAAVYRNEVENVLSLKKENTDIKSLLNIFKKEKGQIYSDHIHFNTSGILTAEGILVSRGNEIIWKEITNHIAKTWKLKKR